MSTIYNNKVWVSELSEKALKKLKRSHRTKLKAEGIYTDAEIEEYVNELENEKLSNLSDAVNGGEKYIIKLSFE